MKRKTLIVEEEATKKISRLNLRLKIILLSVLYIDRITRIYA